jgi:hypothetical protein
MFHVERRTLDWLKPPSYNRFSVAAAEDLVHQIPEIVCLDITAIVVIRSEALRVLRRLWWMKLLFS